MSNPLVSVVVVTYQHVEYIKQCLDSIISQKTDFDFEIIVGEDESVDGTREICLEYAQKYPNKINLLLHERKDVIYINGSGTGRYNFMQCLKKVKGKYIAICEGDDYWCDTSKLQKQINFLESNQDYSICFHAVNELSDNELNRPLILNHLDEERTYTIEDLSRGNFIHMASVMFRNIDADKLPNWYTKPPAGDYPLHLLNAKNGKIKYFPEKMSVYRLHIGGVWSNLKRRDALKKWLQGLNVLIEEGNFSEIVISNLQWQKEKCINEMLELSVSTNWQQFNLDVNEYVLNNPKLISEWMTKRFPAMIDEYRNSDNPPITSKWINFFKPFKRSN